MIYFSKNLKYLREKDSKTQSQIAMDAGFKKAQWSSWETENSYPKLLDFVKISLFFDIPETDLIHTDLENNYTNKHVQKVSKEKENELLETFKDLVTLQREKIKSLELELNFLKKTLYSDNPSLAAEAELKYKKKS